MTLAAPHLRLATGVGLVLATLIHVTLVHHGLGPALGGSGGGFWQPTGFLRRAEGLAPIFADPWLGGALLTLPALVLAALTFALCRSAVVRGMGLSGVAAVAILCFYGLTGAHRVWAFFHWRGSVVILATGLAVGLSLAAPLLAASWLALPARWKLATYLPIFFALVAVIRNATGTDERLFLNISPWPGIPVIGLQMGSYAIAGVWLGTAVGVTALTTRPGPILAGFGILLALCLPVLWLGLRFGWRTLPLLVLSALATGAATALAARLPTHSGRHPLHLRAAHLGLGAALLTLPLVTGQALADADYSVTRHIRARALIDALARYYEREATYPDALGELVETQLLRELPEPRVGFALFYDLGWLPRPDFDYQNLGSSYVLEFVSSDWVMCAYNPPWSDDDLAALEEEEAGAANDDPQRLAEAWSCPNTRPDLW